MPLPLSVFALSRNFPAHSMRKSAADEGFSFDNGPSAGDRAG
jgi:hypothetical protein